MRIVILSIMAILIAVTGYRIGVIQGLSVADEMRDSFKVETQRTMKLAEDAIEAARACLQIRGLDSP